jgi:uncharacterized protein
MNTKKNRKPERKTNFRIFFAIIILSILIFLLSFFILSCSKQEDISKNLFVSDLPDYKGFVNDYTNTLSPDWLKKTDQLVKSVEADTTCEIAVAVIKSLNGAPIEEYTVKLFEKWGIGKKDKDNGALLLVAIADRKLRIEVGYGLEGVVTDVEAKSIIDNVIVPRFKLNDYNTGIYNGVAAIANIIYKEQGENRDVIETAAAEIKEPFMETGYGILLVLLLSFLPWIIIGLIFLIILIRKYIKEHRCPQCNRIGLRIWRKWLLCPTYSNPGRQEVTKLCRYCSYYDKRTVSVFRIPGIYRSGGSHFGGFSSGSSGSHSSSSSFGGGSSGGGGASGSW